MADEKIVKQYLAYWFQAGKRVILEPEGKAYCPRAVIQGDRYSSEFERCWNYLVNEKSGGCYLEGTPQTIHELLSTKWDIISCARCDMPVPTLVLGMTGGECPCSDLPNWPNDDIPRPRSPISSSEQLKTIRNRLRHQTSAPPDRAHGQEQTHAYQELDCSGEAESNFRDVRDRLIQQGRNI
jgi:hypothetical protein